MPRPVCVPCQRFYRAHKNGVRVLEQAPTPYKVWDADLYRCPGCGHETIVGFGHRPISEHFQEDFYRTLSTVTHTVND
jgi:hypothetical protein